MGGKVRGHVYILDVGFGTMIRRLPVCVRSRIGADYKTMAFFVRF